MDAAVKEELLEQLVTPLPGPASARLNGAVWKVPDSLIALDTDSEDSGKEEDDTVPARHLKKQRLEEMGVVMPVMTPQPLPPREEEFPPLLKGPETAAGTVAVKYCRKFWKAGEFEGAPSGDWNHTAGGIDHVRIHPKFLHTNATSHKWVLGAFAELLDNALDEVCSGATYVNVDMLLDRKHQNKMLLIEDNGGGMNPEKIRDCMSLGFSKKSHIADTIDGNGFKTSTMRLGADVIVFSRCRGTDGQSATQSIGLLSYTFLRSTGKEDTIVPMLDYERRQGKWNKMIRSSLSDWNRNVETILQWSPFSSEEDLEHQFYMIREHGTRIIIYNLWEDDEGHLELDFDSDPHDIQIRGVNRDEKNIQMAKQFPNSRHFLTYRHSLRSYAAILYLRLPIGFRIILRGKDVDHHNIVNDMMMSQKLTYRPKDGIAKDPNMAVNVIIGFVKDAKHHIDVQGFNVYHKNRLIKPFWRLWNAAGSDGRGVIGILEANFVEPAHDKQGFERTTILSRLETKLVQMQKTYWSTNCHKIGYAARRNKKGVVTEDNDTSQGFIMEEEGKTPGSKRPWSALDKLHSRAKDNVDKHVSAKGEKSIRTHNKSTPSKYGEKSSSSEASLPSPANDRDANVHKHVSKKQADGTNYKVSTAKHYSGKDVPVVTSISSDYEDTLFQQDYNGEYSPMVGGDSSIVEQLKKENYELKEKLKKHDDDAVAALLKDLQFEKERSKTFETKLIEAEKKIEMLNKEQDGLIEIFQDERDRRDNEVANLRKKLQEASNTIQDLVEKIRGLEGRN